MTIDFSSLQEDPAYWTELGTGVWLMDDHRWALAVWETQKRQDRYTLIHADYHWDGVDDLAEREALQERLARADTNELLKLVAENQWIRLDSFIAPAVRRGLVNVIHFFCLEDDGNDEGLDEQLLTRFGAKQVFHASASSLAAAPIEGPLIFDLCLDLFDRSQNSDTSDLWSDEEVLEFLATVRPLIRLAELVTVSMSFNYSGTAADTRHLSALVVPELLAMRS